MATELQKRVSQLIREKRINLAITQKELGERIGVSESAVTRYESGSLNMSLGVIQKIADALNVDFTIDLKER